MISLSDITDAVADHYHLSPDTLLGRNKARRAQIGFDLRAKRKKGQT